MVPDLGSSISSSQEEIIWERHILDTLGVSTPGAGRSSKISMRRRILMEDISRAGGPVKVSRLLGLSSRVARAYSDTSERTLARDVDELIGLGLLERDKRTLRPRRSSIRPERTED